MAAQPRNSNSKPRSTGKPHGTFSLTSKSRLAVANSRCGTGQNGVKKAACRGKAAKQRAGDEDSDAVSDDGRKGSQ